MIDTERLKTIIHKDYKYGVPVFIIEDQALKILKRMTENDHILDGSEENFKKKFTKACRDEKVFNENVELICEAMLRVYCGLDKEVKVSTYTEY